MAAAEEELAIIGKKIQAIRSEANQTANITNIIERFLSLDIDDTATLRVLLHDLIARITIKDTHFDIEYNYKLI